MPEITGYPHYDIQDVTDEVALAYVESARYFDIPVDDLTRNLVREAKRQGVHRLSEHRIGSHTSAVHRTLVELGQIPDVPTEILPEGHYYKGVSTCVDGEGNVITQWLKTAKGHEPPEAVLARLLERVPRTVMARPGKVRKPSHKLDPDLLAVYPMGDPHIGLLGWAPEVGTDFDLSIAETLLQKAIDELVMDKPSAKYALIANLGDFFHADNQDNKTSRSGHELDVDGRWSKVLQVGLNIMIYLVDRALTAHEKVFVINEIGNHDDHSAVFLSVALGAYYANEPRVQIDMSPARFHYHVFGNNLIGITHGHSVKHQDLESIMATDRPKDWGNTRHRYWYCGHIHTTRRYEFRGCLVETFRTLAGPDAWTSESGYRSGRDMNRIVLHREHGEISRSIRNSAYLESLMG